MAGDFQALAGAGRQIQRAVGGDRVDAARRVHQAARRKPGETRLARSEPADRHRPGAFAPHDVQRAGGMDEGPVYPYAVVRLEFTTDSRALQPLRLGAGASAEAREGERLAMRDCLSCHDHRGVGGTMSNRPWELLKTWSANTNYFRRYVVKPRSVQPTSRMPGFPHYNDGALDALGAYFREWKPVSRMGDGEAGP